MFLAEFKRRNLHPENLATAVENSGTVTSPLVPWNSCGAYMTAALGVSTFLYFPYCFFNFLNPILGAIFGFTGRGSPAPVARGSGRPPGGIAYRASSTTREVGPNQGGHGCRPAKREERSA